MPYNTRRVSVNLTSMGIHLPGSNRIQNRSLSNPSSSTSTPSPNHTPASPDQLPSQSCSPLQQQQQQQQSPPSKRVKRSHTLNSDSISVTPSTEAPPPQQQKPQQQQRRVAGPAAAGTTPPPTPDDPSYSKIDKQGINDDVVVAVLDQLELTGNRPHLIKELAVILTNSLKVVQGSANPTAIISSRLTNYLRRPWTALAPCPLAKEQVTVHPRRVYYYLSTCSRQAIPEYTDAIAAIPANGRIVSPPLSSDPDEDMQLLDPLPPVPVQESDYRHDRDAMSPSPELDDFDLASHYPHAAELEPYNSRGRAQSPPLELDEREFSATACSMQALKRKQSEEAKRSISRHDFAVASSSSSSSHDGAGSPMDDTQPGASERERGSAAGTYTTDPFPALGHSDETEEFAALANREAAAALFGPSAHGAHLTIGDAGLPTHFSSPMLRPLSGKPDSLPVAVVNLSSSTPRRTPIFGPTSVFHGSGTDDVSMGGDDGPMSASSSSAWDMGNPEAIGLNELDDLLGGF